VLSTIEKLIYGPPLEGGNSVLDEALAPNKLNKNDKDFEAWAEWKLGKASKRKGEEIEKTMKDGPPILGTLPTDAGYESRELADYNKHADFFRGVIEEELEKIKDINMFFADYTDKAVLGQNLGPEVKWIMVLQALQFCSNDLANTGVSSGTYKNTIDYLDKTNEVLKHIHEFFDTHRKQNWANTITEKNNLVAAQQIVATKNIWAFIGRVMKSCPTRGGAIFDGLVSYLHSPPAYLTPVPHLEKKVEIIFTGKFTQPDEPSLDVQSDGSAWVHCTPTIAKKFKDSVGEAVWASIESKMYGHWGWVYRMSDLPNRHGHCNSNPNPLLSVSFSGFKFS